VIVVGLVVVFFVAGLIEAFVTPSGCRRGRGSGPACSSRSRSWPTSSASAGQCAALDGFTGAMGEEQRASARLQRAT
jgi:hypothetical protein